MPFSKDVNFGPDNYNQSWLRWDLWDAVNGTCSDSSYHKQSSCLSHGKVWTPAAHSTWNGCVTDRDQNYDTTNTAPVAGATLYPTEQYSSCSVPLMQLTNDWTALNAKVDTMQPVGNTNQAIGLQVGWQTLTATPFTVPPIDSDYKYQTVIILLTDGLNRTLSAFRVAQAGNVAITFAFASLPIIGIVGAAIDYSRANAVKAAMQTALDSTALMLSKEAASDTEDQLKTNATKYFKALFTAGEAKDIDVKVTYGTTGGSNIKVEATAALDARFVNVLGYDTFHLGASSVAKWGITRLRVALVLDNTGSMDSAGKMTALKTATKNLIDQLHGAVTTDGDVYVSIIPFAKDVNLGKSNFAADWIYWGTVTGTVGPRSHHG